MAPTKRAVHQRPYEVTLSKKAQLAVDNLSAAQRSRVLLVIKGLGHWKAIAGAVKSSVRNDDGPPLFEAKVGLLRILFLIGEHHKVRISDVVRSQDPRRSRPS